MTVADPGSRSISGGSPGPATSGVGRGIVLVDANEAMWQFFRNYELPANRSGEHMPST